MDIRENFKIIQDDLSNIRDMIRFYELEEDYSTLENLKEIEINLDKKLKNLKLRLLISN